MKEAQEIQDWIILKEGIQDLKEEAQEPEIILKEGIQDLKNEAQDQEGDSGEDAGNEGENESKDDEGENETEDDEYENETKDDEGQSGTPHPACQELSKIVPRPPRSMWCTEVCIGNRPCIFRDGNHHIHHCDAHLVSLQDGRR